MEKKTTVKVSKKRRQYDDDFRQSAVKMMLNGQSVSYVSQALGVGQAILYKWKAEHSGFNRQGSVDASLETQQLKQRVKQLEMERDILKKALSIFSQVT